MIRSIRHFCEKYDFLSNFYPSPIDYEGITFPTAEHAFQAAKIEAVHTSGIHIRWYDDRMEIARASTPALAKRMGQKIKLTKRWRERRSRVMREILEIKFSDPVLRQKLLDTYPAKLIEETGLGRMLTQIRDGLRPSPSVIKT